MHIERKEDKLTKEQWIAVVEDNNYLVPIHEYEKSTIKSYGYSVFKVRNKVFGILSWDWENKKIDIEVKPKYLPEVYEALLDIASDIGANFYIKRNVLFDPEKHLPILQTVIDRKVAYFETDFFDNLRWLAIRESDIEKILSEFNFREIKKEFITDMFATVKMDEFILMPAYSGWTFIIGDELPSIFLQGNESSTDEALNNLCRSIQKLSKKFIEVQYFEHNDKSDVTGFFKANNGKFIYGYWRWELQSFRNRKEPAELKKNAIKNAHDVASLWSIDPSDFGFIREFSEKKVIIAKKKSGEKAPPVDQPP